MQMRRHRSLTLAILAGSLSFTLAQSASAFSPFGTQFDFETDLDAVLPPTTKQNTDSGESYPAGMLRPGDQVANGDGAFEFGQVAGVRTEELAISAIIAEDTDLDADLYYGPTAARDNSNHVAIVYRGNEASYDSVGYGPSNSSGRGNVRPTGSDAFGYSVDLWLSPHIVVGGTTDKPGPGVTGDNGTPLDPNDDPLTPPKADNPGIQEFLWTNAVTQNGVPNDVYLTEAGLNAFLIDSNGAEAGGVQWRFQARQTDVFGPDGPDIGFDPDPIYAEVTLDADQWVTLETTFDTTFDLDPVNGDLITTLRILNADHTVELLSTTVNLGFSDAQVGGLRYSWFTGIDYSIDHMFVDNWQSGTQLELQPIPEPASLGLLAAGGALLAFRRRSAR